MIQKLLKTAINYYCELHPVPKEYTRNINIVVITEVNEPYAKSIYVRALILLGNALKKYSY
jgi:hypothetical protein